MANVFKDIFDKTRKFTEVIFQQDKPLVDWELNEAQKIQRGTTEDIAKAIMSGAVSVGAGARVTPATASRAVDVAAGTVIAPTGEIMSVTAVTDLAVFSGGTTSGQHQSLVYVEWRDKEVTNVDYADIEEATWGETALRTQREVSILANIGSTSLPAPASGWSNFALATVDHDFDADGTNILQSDIAQPYGLGPGELAGQGPQRTMVLTANNLADETAILFRFLTALTTGKAFRLEGETGALLVEVDKDGTLTLGQDLTVPGDIAVAGTVDGVDVAGLESAYNAHNHDGRYYTEGEVDTLLSGKSNTGHNHTGTYSPLASQADHTALVTHAANAIDIVGVTQGISDNAHFDVGVVGRRALVYKLAIDVGAYTGDYDVFVYADDNTGATLIAQWTDQNGDMEDNVPWFFLNDRTDAHLYVRIVKATTGVSHTFTVDLQAERFF